MSEEEAKPTSPRNNAQLGKEVEGLTDRVGGIEGTLSDVDGKITAIFEILSKQPGSSEPMEADQPKVVAEAFENSDGNAELDIQVIEGADLDDPRMKEKADALAFMREPVDIFIQTTSERNADPVFQVGVNGRFRLFARGVEYKNVPRSYVEVLARSKPITYGNEEYVKPNGEAGVRNPGTYGLRYPFSVRRDDNPKGAGWLLAISSQP